MRPGEIAVHLTGAAVFVLLGFRKATNFWVVMIILGIGIITPSRGAMLACVLPIGVAAILGGKLRRLVPLLLVASLAFAVTYALDVDIALPGGRSMGPRQIVHDFVSITGTSEEANLDNTKTWRLSWWHAIEGYTFHGPYFWTGKGFGQSLAEADGFIVGEENGGPLLRSPHNAHLTLLARTGVPGLVLWVMTCTAWLGMLLRNMLIARRRGDAQWDALFLWIGCYGLSILIDASFDVRPGGTDGGHLVLVAVRPWDCLDHGLRRDPARR
ncbi:MAG: O-antigen ligase family protein [Acetobacteraceae bacterium]